MAGWLAAVPVCPKLLDTEATERVFRWHGVLLLEWALHPKISFHICYRTLQSYPG